MPEATFHFPPDFMWGVATAAHQVEGNNTNNQWWAWEQGEGHIKQGHSSDLACDWWENAEEDFDRAAAMGLNTLRLSVEWSRIEVEPGRIDTVALDRYREMLQALRDRDIEPMVTLHHFSNPIWFEDQGGWTNQAAVSYFNRYVEQVVKALGDYTTLWCTINEPNVYTVMGYMRGEFPPGKEDTRLGVLAFRNLLRAHAKAYKTIHRIQDDARVGLAHNYRVFDPARPKHLLDRLASWVRDVGYNRSVINAVWRGIWTPPLGFGLSWSLRRSLDWIGINYYTRELVQFDPQAKEMFYSSEAPNPEAEMMDGGYGELYPEGLYRAIKRLSRLSLPIYITENGVPDDDDDQRPKALILHLYQIWRTLQQNIPVQGYYHWTLVDNFEWAEGWTLRFGLIELEPETQERRPRPSADLYTAIVQGNAISPPLLDAYAPALRETLLPE